MNRHNPSELSRLGKQILPQFITASGITDPDSCPALDKKLYSRLPGELGPETITVIETLRRVLENAADTDQHRALLGRLKRILQELHEQNQLESGVALIQYALPVMRKDWNPVQENIQTILDIFQDRADWDQIVLHIKQFARLPTDLAVEAICAPNKGKLSCPEELTIVTANNYAEDSLMEKSLRYCGIDRFLALRSSLSGDAWRNTEKTRLIYDAIDTGKIKTPYLLYSDSCDAVINRNPGDAIEMLTSQNCDLLMSITSSVQAYRFMPLKWRKADVISRSHGAEGLYANSGTFVAKTDFLGEVLGQLLKFVDKNDITRSQFSRYCQKGTLREKLPEFPKNVGSDQTLYRYIYPGLYPRFKLDFSEHLALRFWKSRKIRLLRRMEEARPDTTGVRF